MFLSISFKTTVNRISEGIKIFFDKLGPFKKYLLHMVHIHGTKLVNTKVKGVAAVLATSIRV